MILFLILFAIPTGTAKKPVYQRAYESAKNWATAVKNFEYKKTASEWGTAIKEYQYKDKFTQGLDWGRTQSINGYNAGTRVYNAGRKVYETKGYKEKLEELKRQGHNGFKVTELQLKEGRIDLQVYKSELQIDFKALEGREWTIKHHELVSRVLTENPGMPFDLAMRVVAQIELGGAVKKASTSDILPTDFPSFLFKMDNIGYFKVATLENKMKDAQIDTLFDAVQQKYTSGQYKDINALIEPFKPEEIRKKDNKPDVDFYNQVTFEKFLKNEKWDSSNNVLVKDMLKEYPTASLQVIRQLIAQQILFKAPTQGKQESLSYENGLGKVLFDQKIELQSSIWKAIKTIKNPQLTDRYHEMNRLAKEGRYVDALDILASLKLVERVSYNELVVEATRFDSTKKEAMTFTMELSPELQFIFNKIIEVNSKSELPKEDAFNILSQLLTSNRVEFKTKEMLQLDAMARSFPEFRAIKDAMNSFGKQGLNTKALELFDIVIKDREIAVVNDLPMGVTHELINSAKDIYKNTKEPWEAVNAKEPEFDLIYSQLNNLVMAAKLDKSPTEYKNEVQKLNFEWTDKHASIYDRLKDDFGSTPPGIERLELIQLASHFKLIDVQGANPIGKNFKELKEIFKNMETKAELPDKVKNDRNTLLSDLKEKGKFEPELPAVGGDTATLPLDTAALGNTAALQ